MSATTDLATRRRLGLREPLAGWDGNRRRYYVDACDNGGSVEPAPPRDRTWLVMDRDRGQQVAEYDTRSRAREEAARLNRGGAVGRGRKSS